MQKQIVRNNFVFQFDQTDLKPMLCGETLDDIDSTNISLDQQQQHTEDFNRKCTLCGHGLNKREKTLKHPQECKNNDDSLNPLQKKRRKKKDYKKRHQLKIKQQREQAARILEQIIRDIYSLKTNFKKQSSKIDKCLELEKDQARFSQFINHIIRQQVDIIRQQVKNCIKSITFDPISFNVVAKLFGQFQKIKYASPQIQHIINFFMKRSQQGNDGNANLQSPLDQMTFKFILSNDQDIREKLGKFCQVILNCGDQMHQDEKNMIQMMVEMLRQVDLDSDDSQSDYSTSHSSEEQKIQQNQQENDRSQQNSRSRKKNKKKRTQQDYDFSYQAVLARLANFTLDQQRLPCNVKYDWIDHLQNQLKGVTHMR